MADAYSKEAQDPKTIVASDSCRNRTCSIYIAALEFILKIMPLV